MKENCLFEKEDAMLRLDMSEYMERHTRKPIQIYSTSFYSCLKTATSQIPSWLSVYLIRDSVDQGRRVSFKNALVVMTSNVGSSAIAKGRRGSIGFLLEDDESTSYAGMKALVMEELKAYFRPELLNRIDEVVVFRSLEKAQMLEIVNLILQEVKARLMSLGIGLEVSESIKDLICQQGYDQTYGAGPLRRAVTSIVEDPLSEALLAGDYRPGEMAVMDLDASGNLIVTSRSEQNISLSDIASIF
ncbi:hypothetical protein CRYUN_Cryun12cG0184700 [Craigia yunnanensis]